MKLFFCIQIIIILIFNSCLFAQKLKISNVNYKVFEDFIEINYDLTGDETEEYKIDCYLRKENESSFNHKLLYAKGDIGKGKYIGKNNLIKWEFVREFPLGLAGSDYYFVVTVDEISSGYSWYYYVGAAAIGGTAALFLLGGEADKKTTEPVYAPYPTRP